ncbi:MAG: glycosyltransferase family 2 protein [Rhodanobacteraceae bacterium]|nr:glycosyltransferase family 2 protein [Rhodanobacteraceae bacterium]MBP9154841.1 glycosyltransferase family 2 protein [Xanthomonadales bacterium]
MVPVFNESAVLSLLMPRLDAALATIAADVRVLFVDDGSTDATPQELARIANNDARVGVLRLARNFGKEAAMTAGLDHADADAVVIIDADLQDPPEVIREFWSQFELGADVAYGVRISRAGESWLKRITAATFYRLIDRMSDTPIPRDTGDFRLLSRRAVDALRQLRERHRFMKGLFGWVGFKQVAVRYHREPRAAGASKFNFWKLWNFALEGITSFSTVPLRIATWIGLMTALVAFIYGTVIIAKTLIYGEPVRGYPSLMSVMLFLGGTQLVALGIIGEYLGRMYEESKRRPLYLISESTNMAPPLPKHV